MRLQILVPHGAWGSPSAIQCVVNMEKRRCLLRRKDSEKIEELTGFYLCGVYCAKPLRGMGMATDMLLRLLCDTNKGKEGTKNLPFAKIHDPLHEYLSDT